MLKRLCPRQLPIVNSDLHINSTALSAAVFRAARAKAIATQDWPALLRFEWNRVRLAALIANDLEPLALATSAATRLSRAAKIRATRIATRLAAFRMTQSPLAIVVLFSFGEWESGSALGASDFQIRHRCLPEKSLTVRSVVK